MMTKSERFCPLKITSDGVGEYLMMVAETEDSWGLTKVGEGNTIKLPQKIIHEEHK